MSNKIVLMMMGGSGSGKSYLERGLQERPDVKKAVSVTTRPQRTGEEDGVDYHFITEDDYQLLMDKDMLIQTTNFAGFNYGSTKLEYETEHDIVTLVVVPSSAAIFKQTLAERYPDTKVLVLYFDISQECVIRNMRTRGDTEDYIAKRVMSDNLKEQMDASGLVADFVVTDEMLNEQLLPDVIDWLSQQ